jgi:hypothetical protein
MSDWPVKKKTASLNSRLRALLCWYRLPQKNHIWGEAILDAPLQCSRAPIRFPTKQKEQARNRK